MGISINPQVLSVKESATLAINQRAKQMRREGKEIYHFGFGQSPFPVPQLIQGALRDNVDKKDYLPTQGLPALCEAIARFYHQEFGYHFEADQVCVGPGSKELIFEIIYLLEGPLLIPAPSWVSYGPQATIRGKEIIPIMTQRENGYRLQPEELDRACHQAAERQRVLIFTNPNNPTGSCHSEAEIKELAQICRAYKVIVISDEIYSLIRFNGKPYASLVHHYPEGTIVTGGLSKAFSAGGYRLGMMLIPKTLNLALLALKSLISETFSAVSAPIQYAALAAYGNYDQVSEEVQRCAMIHKVASEYLWERFIKMGLNCPKPEGAFYLFPDFANYHDKLRAQGVLTGLSIAETLLQKAQVAVLPASDFYFPATNLGVRVASVDYDGAMVQEKFPGENQMSLEWMEQLFPNLVKGCNRIEEFLKSL